MALFLSLSISLYSVTLFYSLAHLIMTSIPAVLKLSFCLFSLYILIPPDDSPRYLV